MISTATVTTCWSKVPLPSLMRNFKYPFKSVEFFMLVGLKFVVLCLFYFYSPCRAVQEVWLVPD